MKRLFLTAFSTLLCAAGQGFAQTPATDQAQPAAVAAPAVSIRMAWVNLEQAIVGTNEGKREFGGLQKFVDKKNSELQALQKEVETLRNQLKIQGEKLTDQARSDLEVSAEEKETQLQRFSQDTQKAIENMKVRTANVIGRKMLPVLEKISREKGYNAVVTLNPSRDLYVDQSLIITEDVILSYDQMYPGTAAKPAAPAPRNQ